MTRSAPKGVGGRRLTIRAGGPNSWLVGLTTLFLAACATSPTGRPQMAPPGALQDLSAVYSEFDMRLQLVLTSEAAECVEAECVANWAFDQRIVVLGRRLAETAYRLYPNLTLRFPRFEFVVVNKAEAGTASTGTGIVAIYRGVRPLNLDDSALAFVLAREMAHVIAGHHDENVTAGIVVAVAAQILLPMLSVVSGAAAAVTANSAATAAGASTVVASAASFAGTWALRASYRPTQMREAELVALNLLAASGWNARDVASQLEVLGPVSADEVDWLRELRESVPGLAGLVQGPPIPAAPVTVSVPQIVPSGKSGPAARPRPRPPSPLPPPVVSPR